MFTFPSWTSAIGTFAQLPVTLQHMHTVDTSQPSQLSPPAESLLIDNSVITAHHVSLLEQLAIPGLSGYQCSQNSSH